VGTDAWDKVATTAADGTCDVSPQGDPAGFALVKDAPFFDRMVVQGHRPVLSLVVDVEQVFFHCAKAFMRSALWQPETWEPDAVQSRAHIARRLERPDVALENLERYYGDGYAAGLYR
jgi:hypothetical protein